MFLANLRASAITLTAMPLSLAAAVLALRAFGTGINTMTLGGMAIAIGALVDDAIIDVENVVRRLRENHTRPEADRIPRVDHRAGRDARDSVVDRVATIIIVKVFLADLRPGRIEDACCRRSRPPTSSRFWRRWHVAMVVTAGLCFALPAERAIDQRGPRTAGSQERSRTGSRGSSHPCWNHPWPVVSLALALLVVAAVALKRAGTAFSAGVSRGQSDRPGEHPAGTSPQSPTKSAAASSRFCSHSPRSSATARRTGRAEYDEHVQGVEAAEIDVGLRETRGPRETCWRVAPAVLDAAGTNVTIGSRSRTGSITCCRARAPTSP
jgi:Cu/Ag efflux pump CusA